MSTLMVTLSWWRMTLVCSAPYQLKGQLWNRTRMERQPSWKRMNTFSSLTNAGWLFCCTLSGTFPLIYRTISSVRISSEVLPLQHMPTPMGATGLKHITGIIHSETDKPCGTVSDLIWPNDLFKRPLPTAVASWNTRTSFACHSWLLRPP